LNVKELSYGFQNFCLAPGVPFLEPTPVFAPAFPCSCFRTAFVAAAPISVEIPFSTALAVPWLPVAASLPLTFAAAFPHFFVSFPLNGL
jgi:hypothetical protein